MYVFAVPLRFENRIVRLFGSVYKFFDGSSQEIVRRISRVN